MSNPTRKNFFLRPEKRIKEKRKSNLKRKERKKKKE